MIYLKRIFFAVFAVALPIISSAPVHAQLTKINVGYSAISGDALPAWIAKDAGIFEKNGLDVQLVFFTGGTTAVMALVSADTPIAQLAGPAVINSVMAGSDGVIIAGGVTSLNYYLLSRPEIKTPEQLKGGSVAISRFGSSSDFIARYALSKVGLTPGKDVTIVQIGSTTARVDSVLAGRVQATVVQPPASIIAQKRGMNILADLPKLGLVYQHTSAATTRKYIREHSDIVRRYVKSQVEAVHRIYTDKEASIRALARFIGRTVDRDVLEKTWDNLLSEAVLPRKQYPSLEGIKTILAAELKGKSAKPEDFVDSSFIKALDDSGYIDGLYKKR
ncbi:MAG: ABC transporter substrate-binding protein [Deltaproteobacteria bacterium]|nr:ABC transporter substrate-binding protein [Deltaproteobacteria bacterium]MDZ4344823.1 ABC transporter substrate-binding protein [Candidatus Binatia bacterium]